MAVRRLPPVPPGPEQALVSGEGARVPRCGGEWDEVKTLVIGELVRGPGSDEA